MFVIVEDRMKVKIEVELDVDYSVIPASTGRRENGFNIEPDTDAELEVTGVRLGASEIMGELNLSEIDMIRERVAEELMEEVGV